MQPHKNPMKISDFLIKIKVDKRLSDLILFLSELRKEYLPQHARFIEDLEKEGYKLRFSGSFAA